MSFHSQFLEISRSAGTNAAAAFIALESIINATGDPAIPVRAIAAETGLTRSSAKRALDRLEQAGYTSRILIGPGHTLAYALTPPSVEAYPSTDGVPPSTDGVPPAQTPPSVEPPPPLMEGSNHPEPRTCARPRESASQTFVCTRLPADCLPADCRQEDDRTSQEESGQPDYLSQNGDWPDPAKAAGPHWMLSCPQETLRLVEWLQLSTRAVAIAGMYPMETIAAAALRTYQRNRRLVQIGEGELTNRVGFFIHALRNASDLRPPVEEPPPARHSGAHSPPARSASPHSYSRRTAPLEFTPEAVMERMERRNPAMAARMRAAEDPAYQAALEKAWGMR